MGKREKWEIAGEELFLPLPPILLQSDKVFEMINSIGISK
jgi:hypothetical protein